MSTRDGLEQAAAAPDAKLALAQQMTVAGDADKIARALSFAALSGRFKPDDALRAAGFTEPEGGGMPSLDRLAAVARLVDACDTRLWQPDWIMRGPARERCIERMEGRSAEIVAWRRDQEPFGNVPRDICDALIGSGDFAPEAIDAVLAAGDSQIETFERLIRGITLALPLAPGRDRLDALRATFAHVQSQATRASDAGKHAVLGREEELALIKRSITRQWADGDASLSLGALYICGISGAGKSNLLNEVRAVHAALGAVCVTLDFDRPGIEGNDPVGLSRETARQVAEALGAPAARLYGTIAAASTAREGISDTSRIRSEHLLGDMAEILGEAKRPLLLVLDALENLTQHGESAAFELVEWLRAAKSLLPQLAIVGGGRGPFPAKFSGEVESLNIGGLPMEAARQRLSGQAMPEGTADAMIAFADGDPLILDLAAKLGGARLPQVQAGVAAEASSADKAYALYREIIDRIPDPRGQKLARAGLFLRQANPAVLAEVVAPLLGLRLSTDRAAELLDQFGKNSWLVEERDGWLVHCHEQRRVLLGRQIAEDPLQAVRIFQAAARWHEQHGHPVLALYYRLQVFRWRKRPSQVEYGLAILFSDEMIRELPRKAQDLLAVIRGERSTRLRAGAASPNTDAEQDGFDMVDAGELRMLLHRRQQAEATAMVARVEDFSSIDPGSPEAAAVIESLWRAGRWDHARALLNRRRKQLSGVTVVARDLAAMCAAFADLDPDGFRSVLRERRGFAELLFEISEPHGDAADWDVAGLLLLAEGFPTRSTFAQASWALWTGDEPARGEAEGWIGRLTLVRRAAAKDHATRHDLIAALLPDQSHTRMLQHRLQVLPTEQLASIGPLVSAILKVTENCVGHVLPSPPVASFAVDHADACGATADLVTALAVLEPEAGLADIADAARRRMATVAGYWSYGDVPSAWNQPATDCLTAERVDRYTDDAEPQRKARDEIEHWRARFGGAAPNAFARLVSRCEEIARGVSSSAQQNASAAVQQRAQRLIEAGMPLPLAPIFAVLAVSPLARSGNRDY